MHPLLLIPCGKSKLSYPSVARSLYTGNLFKAGLKLAEKSNITYRIVSAKYGIVKGNTTLIPYNLTMKDTSEEYRTEWARTAKNRLNGLTKVYSICGAEYEMPLLRAGIKLIPLMIGMSQGERLSALSEASSYTDLPGPSLDDKEVTKILTLVSDISQPCHKIRYLTRNTELKTRDLLYCGSLLGIDHKTIKAQIWRTRHGVVK